MSPRTPRTTAHGCAGWVRTAIPVRRARFVVYCGIFVGAGGVAGVPVGVLAGLELSEAPDYLTCSGGRSDRRFGI
jgi:hypothetical protein